MCTSTEALAKAEAAPFVHAPVECSRAQKTRPATPRARRRCRVHRIPCPTSVTIAIRPSSGRDGGGYGGDLGQMRTEIFLKTGWTGKSPR
jgi:hypothetical protein